MSSRIRQLNESVVSLIKTATELRAEKAKLEKKLARALKKLKGLTK